MTEITPDFSAIFGLTIASDVAARGSRHVAGAVAAQL
jgi:hypothetical protein